MNECYGCGFYGSDIGCSCPSIDMWYACPIDSAKPENQKELEDYAEWVSKKREEAKTMKYCIMCGCLMDADHDGDICEVCLDELYESDPGEEV